MASTLSRSRPQRREKSTPNTSVASRNHPAPTPRMTRRQVAALATEVAGNKELPQEILAQVVDKTDGVPLFVEELTHMALESGLLQDCGDRYILSGSLAPLAIPATLQDSLMARLDRLASAKAVAQYASVIGSQASYELL